MTTLSHAERLGKLREIVAGLNTDELAVLLFVADRLHKGRERYSALRLREDARDFIREALEEAVDLSAYAAMHLVRAGRVK